MEKLPTEENAIAKLANRVIKILVSGGVKAAKTFLVLEVPFFGWPVISQITDMILNYLGNYVYREGALGTTFFIIDSQTYFQEKAYIKASQKLQEVYEKEGIESENAKKAREEARKKLGDLIRWDGIAKP